MLFKKRQTSYIEKHKPRKKFFQNFTWKDFVYLIIINALIWTHFQIKLDEFLNEILAVRVVQASEIDHIPEVSKMVEKPHIPKPASLDAHPSEGQVVAAARVCENKGLGRECRNDLLAIAYNESRFRCEVTGGLGEKGCFQIMPFHGVQDSQAKDYEWAANWTLERMIRYGYKSNRNYAIKCHNSCNADNNYLAEALRVAKAFN